MYKCANLSLSVDNHWIIFMPTPSHFQWFLWKNKQILQKNRWGCLHSHPLTTSKSPITFVCMWKLGKHYDMDHARVYPSHSNHLMSSRPQSPPLVSSCHLLRLLWWRGKTLSSGPASPAEIPWHQATLMFSFWWDEKSNLSCHKNMLLNSGLKNTFRAFTWWCLAVKHVAALVTKLEQCLFLETWSCYL